MWNQRFSQSDYFYGTHPNVYLEAKASLMRPEGKVLCIGEGEGRNAVYLASLGLQVSAVDFSEQAKEKALALAQRKGVSIDYHVADLATFDFGVEQWDAVVSVFCHLPSSIRALVHKNIFRSLKSEGIFVLESYNPQQLKFGTGGPKDITMLYTPTLMREDFPTAQWIELNESVTELHEGAGHEGVSSVLRGVAKKNEKENI